MYRKTSEDIDETTHPLLSPSIDDAELSTREAPIPLRELLTPQIVIPAVNYTILNALHVSSTTIQLLFLAMPVAIGGLGLKPLYVGYILGVYGLVNSLFQALVLGRVVRRFGPKRVFICAMTAFVPIFALPPVMNNYVKQWGFDGIVWVLLGSQLLCSFVMELGYGKRTF